MPHRSGFVSILGRPNAGKSTLLNALIGDKLAIVSEKPQTTRTAVQGVLTVAEAQIVFLDTPGIHKSDSLINKRMMGVVRDALSDRDILLYLTDCTRPFTEQDEHAVSILKGIDSPAFLLLNKIDALDDKRQMLPRIEQFKALHEFAEFVPVSARDGTGLDELKKLIIDRLPEGPAYFPADYMTDQPERFLAAEMIREKILRETRQEVPHAIAVMVEKWEDTPKLVRISAIVYVERPGQKAIVIGAKGATMKKIGTLARHEIESMLARKVFLEIFVKVRPNWRESPEFLNAIDWRSMTGNETDAGSDTD
ncbi:MAG TPA: GTPase Era [Bryobacteraceae bacterium]|nr:GTPase Era [Bryobacteraceae bacterium]